MAFLGLKFIFIFYRLGEILWFFPLRFFRILKHIWHAILFLFPKKNQKTSYPKKVWSAFSLWNAILFFLVMDLFGIPELYEMLIDFFKFNTRPLNKEELNIAQPIFKESINWDRVRIDEKSQLGPRQKHFAYVSFYTINSWGSMQEATLIHELMHVWQFQQEGSGYIPKALYAQRTKAGYNYGNLDDLELGIDHRSWFSAFNYEQQADIVADYFRIRNGMAPCWGNAKSSDLSVYQSYIDQL